MEVFDFTEMPPDDVVVHCPTREDSCEFLAFLDRHGCVWRHGTKLTEEDFWYRYREEICYLVVDKKVSFSPVSFFKERGCRVISIRKPQKPSTIYTEFIST